MSMVGRMFERKKWRALLMAVAGAWSMNGVAADTPAQALRRFVDGVHTLQASFVQTQTDEKGHVTQKNSGKMWLLRPGRFRWSYEKPKQLILSDGTKIWLYDPDLKQVTVRPSEETLHGTPAELLAQRSTLTDAFNLSDEGTQQDMHAIKLTPKSGDSDFTSIELWLNGDVPTRMVFHDQIGGTTDVEFKDVVANRPLDATLFKFVPPPGVEVVDGSAAPKGD
jgi:outer membrane lipoprotein carrier protein